MFIIPSAPDVAFKILKFPVYWYGITMSIAIFVGIITANKLFGKTWFDKEKDIIIEYAPMIILFGILGARLYYCCLNPEYYFVHPFEILDIRKGGLSIHGGILGGLASIFFMSRKTKIPFLKLIDPLSCGIILGQAIGRWGNYFNSEAYGFPTLSQNWGLYVPLHARVSEFSNYELFHPTFLYESILDLGAFFILFFLFHRFGKKYSGLTFFSYLIIYSLIRFFVESIRIDSALNIGTIPIAQVISVLMSIVGFVGIYIVIAQKKDSVSN